MAVEGSRIVETGPPGDRALWGTLREEVPGERLVMTWHPGRDEASATEDPEPVWLVLEHRPGPAAPAAGVLASPRFAHHRRDLSDRADQGLLVAAGSLPDEPGAGMTVVRAPDPLAAREVVRSAQDEDGSVTAGLPGVRIRPWTVVLTRS